MEIVCKVLEAKDVLDYRKIRLESLDLYPRCFGSTFIQESSQKKLFFEEQIEIQSKDNIMIGAFYNNILIGLCGLIGIDNMKFKIVQMYVQKKYKGHGIGYKLLCKSKSILFQSERTSIILTVFNKNNSALKLYEKTGFVTLDIVNNEIFMEFKPCT